MSIFIRFALRNSSDGPESEYKGKKKLVQNISVAEPPIIISAPAPQKKPGSGSATLQDIDYADEIRRFQLD